MHSLAKYQSHEKPIQQIHQALRTASSTQDTAKQNIAVQDTDTSATTICLF
jgi:hypothetical protein